MARGEGSGEWDDTVYTISTCGAEGRKRATGGEGLHRFGTTGRIDERVDEEETANVSIAVRVGERRSV